MYHFNNPNNTENGKTQAGGDYYYSYGEDFHCLNDQLIITVAEHQKQSKKLSKLIRMQNGVS